jgi:hypothetical protein
MSDACNCKLAHHKVVAGIHPEREAIGSFVFHAHRVSSFLEAMKFETVLRKEKWDVDRFATLVDCIHAAGCRRMDDELRKFHREIRNNGLWHNWISSVARHEHFRLIMLDELANVMENLSPRFIKDLSIHNLLDIFGNEGVHVYGKKRKLKRQVTKWCEVQDTETLDLYYGEINKLKWLMLQVIEEKDRENKMREQTKRNNYRNSHSPSQYQKFTTARNSPSGHHNINENWRNNNYYNNYNAQNVHVQHRNRNYVNYNNTQRSQYHAAPPHSGNNHWSAQQQQQSTAPPVVHSTPHPQPPPVVTTPLSECQISKSQFEKSSNTISQCWRRTTPSPSFDHILRPSVTVENQNPTAIELLADLDFAPGQNPTFLGGATSAQSFLGYCSGGATSASSQSSNNGDGDFDDDIFGETNRVSSPEDIGFQSDYVGIHKPRFERLKSIEANQGC